MSLTEQQIVDNWNTFISIIKSEIAEPRKSALIKMYEDFQEDLILAPAAGNENYHNCFPGGYIDHVIRVVNCAKTLYSTWKDLGANVNNFTMEELIFSAINHDLGKAGDVGMPYYIPNPSDWHRKNQGALYELNSKLHYMKVPDRSLFTLQKYGISVSESEYLAIKLHDGMYSDANKGYYMAFKPELGLKSNIAFILHHADHLASRIEHDNKESKNSNIETVTVKSSKPSVSAILESNGASVDDLFKDFFKK
jgi:hypothetical protein